MTADGTLCAPTTIDTSHSRRRVSSAGVLDSRLRGNDGQQEYERSA